MKLTLLIDVDGVLSTGQFLYSSEGKSFKIFGPHDSDGLKTIREKVNIHFISADVRGFDITQKRVEDMGFTVTLVPEENRFDYVRNTWKLDETIYIGDGIYDAALLAQCLHGIAPANARPEAKAAARFITPSKAGEGAVCDACLHIKEKFLDAPLVFQEIDRTPRYHYERIRSGAGHAPAPFSSGADFHTLYAHAGGAVIEVNSDSGVVTYHLRAGQGWYATPGTKWRLLPRPGCDIFHVHSQAPAGEPIIQIIDDGQQQIQSSLQPHGLIMNPKRVTKPWGFELWIMWSRDYHVLKQIVMNVGHQSSLQVHRHKLETNYLVQGEADVIDQLPIDTTQSETTMTQALHAIDVDHFKERKVSGMHWTSTPGTVHRVIAATQYTAYEVSTPELDDVIRLKDDTDRVSGRIVQEHRAGAI